MLFYRAVIGMIRKFKEFLKHKIIAVIVVSYMVRLIGFNNIRSYEISNHSCTSEEWNDCD